jgi:outer membrane lipoprotein-sorting protein
MKVTTHEARSKWLIISCACLLALSGCNKASDHAGNGNKEAASAAAPRVEGDATEVINKYRALDSSRNSVQKISAKVDESDGSTRQVGMTIYRKRQPDASSIMLLEITVPAQERDRSALISVSPIKGIEATRYAQSSDSFVTTTSVLGEDALLGMTLQELADGQTEKYDFKLIGEEALGASQVYRVDGKLKAGAESKFPRLVMLISKENSMALAAEFYDNRNELARRIVVERAEQVGGYWTRKHWTVDNRARQKKIDFQATAVKYDQPISDSIFTREHLKKIAAK